MSKLNFTIGADPEISLLYGNKRIDANGFFKYCCKVNRNSNGEIAYKEGMVGVDGCSSTAELRPSFSNDPMEVANNIGTLIKKLHDITPVLEMTTTNYYAPIGGHVHLSLMPDIVRRNMTGKEISKIQRRHTNYMALFQLPLIASYNKHSEMIRNASGGDIKYGTITDTRFDVRGDSYVMEYRAPNAEWLISEKICKSTIAYYAMIHNEVLNHYDEFYEKCKTVLADSKEQYQYLQNLMLTDYAKLSKKIIVNINKIAKTCELYNEYKAEIDYILDYKQVYKDKMSVDFNIGKGWNLIQTSKITKKKMFDEKLINTNIEDKNLDALVNFLDIAYNKDHNCQVFANAIAKRSIAYNWKYDNYYFIYGLRKGLKDYIVSDEDKQVYKELSQMSGAQDVVSLNNLLDRIKTKFENAIYSENRQAGTNLSKFLGKKIFFIGIPYEERDKINTKPLLELIFNLEKKKLSPILLDKAYAKEIGELTMILNKDIQTEGLEEIVDNCSQGASYASGAIIHSLREEESNR